MTRLAGGCVAPARLLCLYGLSLKPVGSTRAETHGKGLISAVSTGCGRRFTETIFRPACRASARHPHSFAVPSRLPIVAAPPQAGGEILMPALESVQAACRPDGQPRDLEA